MRAFQRSAETVAEIDASLGDLFAFLDDHRNLGAHMSKPSAMTLGSTMDLYVDGGAARAVGSKFGFKGSVLGLPLAVDEVVTARDPPLSKTWETTRDPTLWVIGSYRMGFELRPQGPGTRLRVFIDYDLPAKGLNWLLGLVFGHAYATWCTGKMVADAKRQCATGSLEHVAPIA